MNLTFETLINRSRADVWQAFDNPANLAKWQPTLKSFELQSGDPGQVGAVSRLVYEENGRTVELIETITSRNEPDEFSGTYDSSVVRNVIRNRFSAVDANTTRWSMETEFVFKNFFFKLMAPFMRSALAKRTQDDMTRFKALIESGNL